MMQDMENTKNASGNGRKSHQTGVGVYSIATSSTAQRKESLFDNVPERESTSEEKERVKKFLAASDKREDCQECRVRSPAICCEHDPEVLRERGYLTRYVYLYDENP